MFTCFACYNSASELADSGAIGRLWYLVIWLPLLSPIPEMDNDQMQLPSPRPVEAAQLPQLTKPPRPPTLEKQISCRLLGTIFAITTAAVTIYSIMKFLPKKTCRQNDPSVSYP